MEVSKSYKKPPWKGARETGSVVGAVFSVVVVDFADVGAVGRGEAFGFFDDGATDVRARIFGPAAVGANLTDSAAVLAKMPMRFFAGAVGFADIDFHTVTVG